MKYQMDTSSNETIYSYKNNMYDAMSFIFV